MHARFLVLIERTDEAETSRSARKRAYNQLVLEGFITAETGLFSSAPADWFVIGGRWSGDLSLIRLDPKKLEAFQEECAELILARRPLLATRLQVQECKEAVTDLFRKHFPESSMEPAPISIVRDHYSDLGYDDDAQILDQFLLEYLKSQQNYYERDTLHDGNAYAVIDQPDKELSQADIGKYWVVVVDLHY